MNNIILVTGGNGLVGNGLQQIINQYSDYKFIFLIQKYVI